MRSRAWATLLIFFWFGMPSTLHADERMVSPFELGARGAYSRVTLFRGSDSQGAGKLRSRNSFAAGLSSYYGLHATEWVYLGAQPELLFVRRGAEAEYEGLVVGIFQHSYLELPILGHVRFPLSGTVSPYIVAGPRLGLLLRAETTDANGNVRDSSDSTSSFDVGFSAGAGALIHVSSRVMLTIEGRYDQSLTNRLKPDGEEGANDQRHRAFFLMLGVSMGIGDPAPASADASPAP